MGYLGRGSGRQERRNLFGSQRTPLSQVTGGSVVSAWVVFSLHRHGATAAQSRAKRRHRPFGVTGGGGAAGSGPAAVAGDRCLMAGGRVMRWAFGRWMWSALLSSLRCLVGAPWVARGCCCCGRRPSSSSAAMRCRSHHHHHHHHYYYYYFHSPYARPPSRRGQMPWWAAAWPAAAPIPTGPRSLAGRARQKRRVFAGGGGGGPGCCCWWIGVAASLNRGVGCRGESCLRGAVLMWPARGGLLGVPPLQRIGLELWLWWWLGSGLRPGHS